MTLDTIKNDITVKKFVDGTEDVSFVKDNALLELIGLNLANYEVQNVVINYDTKTVTTLSFKINAPVIDIVPEISETSFSYFTTANDIIANISAKRFIDSVEDTSFTYDSTLVSLADFTEKSPGTQTIIVSYNSEEIGFFEITIAEPVKTYTATIATTNFVRNSSIDTIKNAITVVEKLDGVTNDEFVKDNTKLTIEGLNLSVAGTNAALIKYDGANALVTIINVTPIPSTLSTDIASKTFTVNVPTEFTFSTVANDDAGKTVVGSSNFSDPTAIAKLEYYEVANDTWYDLNGNFGGGIGFPMSDATSRFRVTFNRAGNYSFTATMNLLDGGAELCNTNVSFTVGE